MSEENYKVAAQQEAMLQKIENVFVVLNPRRHAQVIAKIVFFDTRHPTFFSRGLDNNNNNIIRIGKN